MNERETQCRQILRYMEEHGMITQRIASRELDCDRLASRICDLKHDGYPIRSEFDYKLDENGKVVKKWKRYWLAAQHGQEASA